MQDRQPDEPGQLDHARVADGVAAGGEGQAQEALDSYGKVIATDVRPTRAEAVYRTLLMLEKSGDIDLAKATDTLAAEAMTWVGSDADAPVPGGHVEEGASPGPDGGSPGAWGTGDNGGAHGKAAWTVGGEGGEEGGAIFWGVI